MYLSCYHFLGELKNWFGPMTFHTRLCSMLPGNTKPSVHKASLLKFQVTSDCNKMRGKFPLGLTLQNLGVNIYIYIYKTDFTILTHSEMQAPFSQIGEGHWSSHPPAGGEAKKKINVARGHWHLKLILSYLHAGLNLVCSVSSLSHPSVTTCRIIADYSMIALQAAS